MIPSLALIVATVFIVPALWHSRMACGPMTGEGGAVPSVDGKPLFVPSRGSTVTIGIVLLLFAGLVSAAAGTIDVGLPPVVLRWSCYGLAIGLLARGVGDFRYVGLCKRVRDSRFAMLDTRVYSPLCCLLAAAVARVAWQTGAPALP